MARRETKVTRKVGGGTDILQVAKLAGVSASTVSRVANGSLTVDKKMAKRVWEAIEKLGYIANPQARALVSGRSRTLGLLISEITNPFFPELIQSFEDIAGASDFEVMVGSTNYNLENARKFIKRLVQRRVEGVAVMTFRSESPLLDELIKNGTPIVSIDVEHDAPGTLVLHVDYAEGINQAIQHLALLGHRRIGFASGPLLHFVNLQRKKAFVESIRTIGLELKPQWIFETAHTPEGGAQSARHFLRMSVRPTAIVCSNDLMAVGVLRVLAQEKVKVPQEISVVGFDDIHLAEFVSPPLTTVRMSREDIARRAFDALMQLRDPERYQQSCDLRVPTSLVIRQSTSFQALKARGLNLKHPRPKSLSLQ